jgi:hypothetical protein
MHLRHCLLPSLEAGTSVDAVFISKIVQFQPEETIGDIFRVDVKQACSGTLKALFDIDAKDITYGFLGLELHYLGYKHTKVML